MPTEMKPAPKALEPKSPELAFYSVHLPPNVVGSRRRVINLGNRGRFAFDADVDGKENKKVRGYPHHRMRLTPAEVAQFEGDGFKVRKLQEHEIEAGAGTKAMDAAVRSMRSGERPAEPAPAPPTGETPATKEA